MKKIARFFTLVLVLAMVLLASPKIYASEGTLTINRVDETEGAKFEVKQTHEFDGSGRLVEIEKGMVVTKWSDAEGELTLKGLPLGRYEVRELRDKSGEFDSNVYSLTLPFFDDLQEMFVYNVYLHTAHEVFGALKEQSKGGVFETTEPIEVTEWEVIDYSIQVQVPDDIHEVILADDGAELPKYTKLVIADELHPALSFVEGSAWLLASNSFFTTKYADYYYPTYDKETRTVTLTLGEDAIEYLVPGEVLRLIYVAKINGSGSDVGEVEGAAKVTFVTQDHGRIQTVHKTFTNVVVATVESEEAATRHAFVRKIGIGVWLGVIFIGTSLIVTKHPSEDDEL